MSDKNQAAQALAQKRWEGTTPEERSRVGKLGGRPRSRKRCFCGANTMLRAAYMYFDCCRKAGVVTINMKAKEGDAQP